MFIRRNAQAKILELAQKYPAISLTGPRQSGKTTLVREAFPDYEYLSMENPDTANAFSDDPRSFLKMHGAKVVFDEAQRTPELFSYLQQVIDSGREPGRFVLTGSQNFLLLDAVSQSLAGRIGLVTLLPFSLDELAASGAAPKSLEELLVLGGYPRLYDAGLSPADFFESYVSTYLERDVRQELGVRKLRDFHVFLQLCALRTGQQLNVSALAKSAGIAVGTAREWLSILEASGVIYLLEPFFSNRNKSLVKAPKLYFLDTGLAAFLIGVRDPGELVLGPYRGPLFESFVVSELLKAGFERGMTPQLSYWRDKNKNEIDIVVSRGLSPVQAIEVKSSATYKPGFFDAVNRIAGHELGLGPQGQAVVYGGDERLETERGALVPYRDLHERALSWLA